jgi:hypothetical protein
MVIAAQILSELKPDDPNRFSCEIAAAPGPHHQFDRSAYARPFGDIARHLP